VVDLSRVRRDELTERRLAPDASTFGREKDWRLVSDLHGLPSPDPADLRILQRFLTQDLPALRGSAFARAVLARRVATEREFANGRADQPAWRDGCRGRCGMDKQTVALKGREPAPAQAVAAFGVPEHIRELLGPGPLLR